MKKSKKLRLIVGLLVLAFAAVACQPQIVEVEKEVQVTVEVEKEVEKIVDVEV